MFDKLAAEFPRDAVSWRAQSVTKDGSKAMALAYIDARDVMDRLDEVCGPGNWQDRYEFAGPKTICYLSIKIGDEWVTKADGAGDTAVEAEKGAISDAFKRAAVKWGVGRYLYALDAPWVPCECSEFNGKKQWRRWKADPWQFVKGASTPSQSVSDETRHHFITACRETIRKANSADKLGAWWNSDEQKKARRDFELTKPELDDLMAFVVARRDQLSDKEAA
ncbi:Rad52/Rad22 family DNA repair protein [Afipia carboxidovorans]|uniref:Rad52/Rad22 family DNA repair protein n=1 Tax=Afipia carboxidovorans TaxID=40137 RepID=UPI003087E65B|nr:hypothetical protein CRBSH125_09780 [Afipia carboxidovorans]BEV47324.1 hypothetical protein CRBSH125_35070 [Afipia carboxidovorans]